MPQNRRQIKLTTILLLTTILISQFFLISLAKTEVYFSFFYNSISPALQKPEDKTININSASQEELTRILQISDPLARKIIALRDKLGGFKKPQSNY
ncbi:helix-hairpin-helix domain-containing protein [Candidatus Atribacteria bacterium 1244-E10-H5-B2]|nr:MAG: helix-hairpin-helix domain-containing protein [Candidatus Atribacteria bacterium 1244-E10-H5-B2]